MAALPPRLRRKAPSESNIGRTPPALPTGAGAGAAGGGGGGVSGKILTVSSATELEEKGIAGRASSRGVAGSKRFAPSSGGSSTTSTAANTSFSVSPSTSRWSAQSTPDRPPVP
ncbi:unnamed protein product, partial [Ectocarpus sp. 6 AP-2014]